MLPTFSQNLTLQEAFETAAQINEEPKRMYFDGAFCKLFELLIFFLPNLENRRENDPSKEK